MVRLLVLMPGLVFGFCAAYASAEQPATPSLTADAIMARVAANQDAAQAERTHYIYTQHAKVVSRKGRTVMCEEITDSRVTPTASGSRTKLLKLDGRMLVKNKYVTYTMPKTPPPPRPEDETNPTYVKAEHDSLTIEVGGDTDRDLVEHTRMNLLNDESKGSDSKDSGAKDSGASENDITKTENSAARDSKDGIEDRLFPLTSKSQSDYLFHLLGQERMNGRDVFHITFHPKSKEDFSWKGDAYIDVASFQPVVIITDLSRKIPLAVRTLLGTNVPGLGFTITYALQPDGVWFPTSLSTEFKIHLLFFFNREIIIDAQNRGFEKTHVSARIVSTDDPAIPSPPGPIPAPPSQR